MCQSLTLQSYTNQSCTKQVSTRQVLISLKQEQSTTINHQTSVHQCTRHHTTRRVMKWSKWKSRSPNHITRVLIRNLQASMPHLHRPPSKSHPTSRNSIPSRATPTSWLSLFSSLNHFPSHSRSSRGSIPQRATTSRSQLSIR